MKKEEPDAAEPKQEPMETEEKKPEMKAEPKEEEESGANSTSATSTTQNRKKSKNTDLICTYEVCNNILWYDILELKHWLQYQVNVLYLFIYILISAYVAVKSIKRVKLYDSVYS